MQRDCFSAKRVSSAIVSCGALAGAVALAALADPELPPQVTAAFPGRYLMAFSASVTNTQLSKFTHLAYSDDGASWNAVTQFHSYQASVPDVVIRSNILYVYTPDPDILVRYDVATGTTNQSPVQIFKAAGGTDDFGDVSAYLDPATDKIVLFYKSTLGVIGDPQYATNCPERSATEIDGSNGSQFLMDDGDRLTAAEMARKGDTDMFFDGTRYLLYVGKNTQSQGETPKVFVYTCATLRGTYVPLATLSSGMLTQCGSVPQGYYDSATSNYWTYITVLSPTVSAVIRRAVHHDFSQPLSDADFTTVLAGSNYPGLGALYSVEGPGVVVNTTSNVPPGVPSSVNASDGTYSDKVRVSWSAASGATIYEVWRNTTNSSASAAKLSGSDLTGTNYDDTGASAGITYYYWVKAANDGGASAFSSSDTGFMGVVGPLITANGLVGSVYLNSGDLATIAVQMMNIDQYLGAEVDWWIVVGTSSGGWYYLDSSMQWVIFGGDLAFCRPVYQGALMNLSSRTILDRQLPSGTYNFWFAVDYPMDGILNPNGQILLNKVTVYVP